MGLDLIASNRVTNTFATTLPYTLPSTDSWYGVYLKLYRGGGDESDMFGGQVILDTTPPTLSVTNPVAGATTDVRWIDISGIATDALSAVRVQVDGAFVDQSEAGGFEMSRLMLEDGTNTF